MQKKQQQLVFLLLLFVSSSSLGQRYTYKFYQEGDSAKFAALQEISSRGFYYYADSNKVIYDKQKAKISYEEYKERVDAIRKYAYLKYAPDQSYTILSDALKSDNKDTIEFISIYGQQYDKIPLSILAFKRLKKLEIIDTKINKLPWLLNWSLFGLDSLQELRIYNQELSKPFKFKKNTHIKILNYRENPNSPKPKNLPKLSALIELDLVRNDFNENIHFRLDKFKHLKEANFRNNAINIDNLTKSDAPSITNLILSRNDLKAIPASISKFPNLEELQLAENQISSEGIAEELSKLSKLEILSFYKNQLTYLPAFIFELKALTELDLYYNQIEIIPTQIKALSELNKLYLANNKIYSIPEEIGQLSNLEELYLKYNRISYLPNSLCKLTKITDFHINNNYLQGFPECVLSFRDLQDLDISYNDIHSIPNALLNLPKLQLLWMRGITFEARDREEASEIKNTIEGLQSKGVKVSIDLE